jgi:putative membrane-bound dehydrogenase-like protein
MLAVVALCTACSTPRHDREPLEPSEALKSLEVIDGFRIELIAAEPLVIDPVEIAFDENGGLYVAELEDNPEDPPPGEPALSRIVYLEDTDWDGTFDQRTVFAEHVLTVEGVLPWKGGVIATAAPDILYLKDTDGDHRADIREVLYTGFRLRNPEGRVSNPRLGLDNWVYVLNGGEAGEIQSEKHPERPPMQVRGWDFRFRPDGEEEGLASGDGQFGHALDNWGNRYVSQNTRHIRQAVIPAHYLLRNRFLTVTGADQDISDHGNPAAQIFPISQPQQWRIDRTEARQERYAETNPGRIERLGGYFTASCGATVYTGDAFPADYRNNVFVTDGNGNLVHRDVITPGTSTMTASRQPANRDFCASTDNWFRPVNFANGPDGNLYVVDYYRQYLEHPNFIPEAVQERLEMDFRAGDTRGRIYRIVPDNPAVPARPKPNLSSATTAELVALLDHENGWHRRTAHRLLLERQDQTAVPLLEQSVAGAATPQGRLHALWLIEGLSALKPASISIALKDAHWAVRRNALQLAEAFLPELGPSVVAMVGDDSSQVHFQLALTLGEMADDPRAVAAMATLGARYADDKWFRLALASAPPAAASRILTNLLRNKKDFFDSPSDDKAKLLSDLSRVVGARRNARELSSWLAALSANKLLAESTWRAVSLKGLAEGLKLEGRIERTPSSIERAIARLLAGSDPAVQDAAAGVAQYFSLPGLVEKAVSDASNESLDLDERISALYILRGAPYRSAEPVLRSILTTASPGELQQAAASTAASFSDASAAEMLLAGWQGYGPQVRTVVADALLARPARARTLLDAVESGDVALQSLDSVTRIKLTQYPDEEIKHRAQQLFDSEASDRAAVLAEYQDVIELPGDSDRGKVVFERECAKCHMPRGERSRVGPNLSGVNNRGKETLLSHILEPSGAIEARYTNYILVTRDGYVHDGMLAGETPGTVTLRGELEDITVLRENIEELRASTVSLMPDGLEETMTSQELANVIAYLRAGL